MLGVVDTEVGLSFGGRRVGPGAPTLLVAEVGQAHDGSLGIAHSFIDAVAAVGFDAVKFQTHIAEAESTLDEPFRVPFSYEDDSRFGYWKRMSFSPEQWMALAQHARDVGLLFISTPFSNAAVQLLEQVDVKVWKIGSGEARQGGVLDAVAATGKPVVLSTGMSTWQEIDEAVDRLTSFGTPIVLMQCTSQYPTPLEAVGLNVIREMMARYGVPVGLSDHSATVFPALAAMARGAAIIEVHVAFSRRMFGPDSKASLELDELRLLVEARDAFAAMDANPVDKDVAAAGFSELRAVFGRSVALLRSLPAGSVLKASDLTTKKPGGGIPTSELGSCVGRALRVDVSADRLLRWDDLV